MNFYSFDEIRAAGDCAAFARDEFGATIQNGRCNAAWRGGRAGPFLNQKTAFAGREILQRKACHLNRGGIHAHLPSSPRAAGVVLRAAAILLIVAAVGDKRQQMTRDTVAGHKPHCLDRSLPDKPDRARAATRSGFFRREIKKAIELLHNKFLLHGGSRPSGTVPN